MKKKLILLMLLIASFGYEAFAIKVIIRGGTRRNTYNEIIYTPDLISCTGRGPNFCPVQWATTANESSVPVRDIVDFVSIELKKGNLNGNATYGSSKLPVSWKAKDEENVQIEFPGKLEVTKNPDEK